jgi:GMC oxidoreductase
VQRGQPGVRDLDHGFGDRGDDCNNCGYPTLPATLAQSRAVVKALTAGSSRHQRRRIPNLFICDGSAMTTGGACNPTSTIGALGLRCADMIVAKRQELT